MNISDEAVEAAARATFVHANLGAAWEDAQPDWRDAYRASVLAGLEAAAPYIAAEAWAENIPSPYHPLGEGVRRVTGIPRSAVTNRYRSRA